VVYHTDGLGSVRAITETTSPNALVIQTYRTAEFGIPDPSGTMGASTQPMQYTGEQRDAESNFMYLRARMYDPSIGRFMQADPLRKSALRESVCGHRSAATRRSEQLVSARHGSEPGSCGWSRMPRGTAEAERQDLQPRQQRPRRGDCHPATST
jgi:RHS repeat-associated protein